MKKLLSLLSILTISGTAMPNIIAAKKYEKGDMSEKDDRTMPSENNNNEILSLEQSKNILGIFNNDTFVEKLRQDVLQIYYLRSNVNYQYIIKNNLVIKNLDNFNYINTGNQIFLIYQITATQVIVKEIKLNTLNIGTPEEILRNLKSAPNYHLFWSIKSARFSPFEKDNDNKKWGWIINTSKGKYKLTFDNFLKNELATKIEN